jgi:hemerythrin superfamily protein
MSDVFQVLKVDHEAIEELLERLEAGRRPAGPEDGWPTARQKLIDRIVIEESKHEAVEEEFFWPAVREHVAGGDELADEAIEQEQRSKALLDELDGLAADDPRIEDLLSRFIDGARAHMAFEETRVWPRLRRALGNTQSIQLGTKLNGGKKLAPTHPHPGIPPEPGILKASGVMTAVADRLKDAATGRGRD